MELDCALTTPIHSEPWDTEPGLATREPQSCHYQLVFILGQWAKNSIKSIARLGGGEKQAESCYGFVTPVCYNRPNHGRCHDESEADDG